MTKRKNTNQPKKLSRAHQMGSALINTSKKALNSPLGRYAVNEIKRELKAIASQYTGIPFNTSGNYAIASPNGGGGGVLPVSIPAANGTTVRNGKPRMSTLKSGNMVVTHREYIADVDVTTTGFDLQFKFGINPGNSALFPWLSQVAQRFELYSFRYLRIIYEPQTSTTSVGTLMFAVDYDASDPPPSNKTQMMSYKNSVRSPFWFACTHDSASADLHRLKTNYILVGEPPMQSDIKTFDIGNLWVAVQSDSSSLPFSAGELYVEYSVELITPQINPDTLSSLVLGYPPGSMDNEFLMGTSPLVSGPLSVQVFADTSVVSLYILTAGFYQVVFGTFGDSGDLTRTNEYNFNNACGTNFTNCFVTGDSANPGESGNISIYWIEVVNPNVVCFEEELTGTGNFIPTQRFYSITPISQDAIPAQNFTSVFPPVSSSFRSRLGRIPSSLQKTLNPMALARVVPKSSDPKAHKSFMSNSGRKTPTILKTRSYLAASSAGLSELSPKEE